MKSINDIMKYIVDNLIEVYNSVGGVIGYKLELNPDETEKLLKLIENNNHENN